MKNEIEFTIESADMTAERYEKLCQDMGITDKMEMTNITIVSSNPAIRDLRYHGHIQLEIKDDKIVMSMMNDVYDRVAQEVVYRFKKQIEMDKQYLLLIRCGFAQVECNE